MCVMCTLSGVTENIPNVPHIEDGKIIAHRIQYLRRIFIKVARCVIQFSLNVPGILSIIGRTLKPTLPSH